VEEITRAHARHAACNLATKQACHYERTPKEGDTMSRRAPPYLIASLLLCPAWLACAPAAAQTTTNADPNRARASPGGSTAAGVVNINTASAEELERLPGIGPTRARAILTLRAHMTHFTRSDELLRVKGIGRATYRKLRALVVLSGETTLTSEVPRRSS
jgi:competence ComEA-like helix-hairpin-helix protein